MYMPCLLAVSSLACVAGHLLHFQNGIVAADVDAKTGLVAFGPFGQALGRVKFSGDRWELQACPQSRVSSTGAKVFLLIAYA